MNNKPFEQWWAGLEATDKPGCRYLKIDYRKIHMDESEARELHAQIIEAADYAMPCTIMRRFAQMDDSPLGCYVPVAYCDHYGAFEELIEAAGKPHALICIQRQEEKRKPKPEPKPAKPYVEFVVEMRFPGEAWIERGRFDTQEDANVFTHEDGAFAPPGQREYRVRRSDETPEPGHLQGGSIVLESRGELAKVIALDKIKQAIRQENKIIIHTEDDVDVVHFGSHGALQKQWEQIQANFRARKKTPPPSGETPKAADPS